MADAINKFSFFESFGEAAMELPDDQRLAFYDALVMYAFHGVEPEFTGILKVAWALAKPNIDTSIKRSKTNAENARKATAETTAKTVAKTTAKANGKANAEAKPSKDKDMDRDKDRDMEMEADGKEPSEVPFQSARASVGAAAVRTAPPQREESLSPHCPLCEVLLKFDAKRGKWTCPNCLDDFEHSAVMWL